MPGQVWVSNSLGGYAAAPILSKEVRMAAQPLMRFMQFCLTKESFGKGRGDTVLFDKIGNVETGGAVLTETSTIPSTQFSISQGTIVLKEYGNSIPVTGKLLTLADIDIKTPVIKALKNDSVKTLEKEVEAQMNRCKVRYVGLTASTGAITTNGTATQTCSTPLTGFHVRKIVDYLMGTLYAPPADGEFYFGILSIRAASSLYESLEGVWQYTQFPVNGELGKYYKCRLVRDAYSMNNNIGANNISGEAYFFGDEAVAEAVAVPVEIRTEPAKDFGRSNAFAWFAIEGFELMWQGDPDNRVVKWTSA